MRLVNLGLLASLACTCATADVIAGTGTPSATTLGQRTATQLVGEQAGIGHALIVPYYSTQNGNVSVFSITNTDRANGKAVKVRVRGAGNGDSLLSLTVLLGPGDVWNATLRQGANGVAELMTYDSTCAIPRVAEGVAQPLSTARLNSPTWTDADKTNQTREGYVEILSMADIPRTSPTSALFEAIRRDRYPATPCGESLYDATAIFGAVSNLNHTIEATAASVGLAAPTSGIAGKWLIINAPETTTFAGSMYALRAVDDNGEDARANFVLFPQTAAPYSGAADDVTADPLFRTVVHGRKTYDGVPLDPVVGPARNAAMNDLPDLSTPYVVSQVPDAALIQADRLSASMVVRGIRNEYATEPTLAARTDWIISMPARRYSVAVDYGRQILFNLVPSTGKQYFHSWNVGCWDASMYSYDREGTGRTNTPAPMHPLIPHICGAVSVVSIGPESASVVGASVTRQNTGLLFQNGWASLGVDSVPLIGSAFIRFYNPSVSPGISGNYGITFDHWLTR